MKQLHNSEGKRVKASSQAYVGSGEGMVGIILQSDAIFYGVVEIREGERDYCAVQTG